MDNPKAKLLELPDVAVGNAMLVVVGMLICRLSLSLNFLIRSPAEDIGAAVERTERMPRTRMRVLSLRNIVNGHELKQTKVVCRRWNEHKDQDQEQVK